MKVAVVLPAYNAQRFIEDAIASLLRQQADVDLDIIVVDDGSTDSTNEIVRRLEKGAPEIRLITQPNAGIAGARNAAIAAIRPDTDLVTFLDADDLSPAGRFQRDVARFEADPELELHYGTSRVFRDETAGRLEPDPYSPFVEVRNIQLANLLMRVSLLHRVGPFDNSFTVSDDVDFLFRALELGPKLAFVDDIAVYYRRHEGNITRTGEVSTREFARAVMMAARRRRNGAAAVPKGFFNAKETLESLEWW